LRGQKPKSHFEVKYAENGRSYDVGPNEHDLGHIDSRSLDLLPKIFGLLVIFVTDSL